MRVLLIGTLGAVLAASPVAALPQSGCPATVITQLRDARLAQGRAEAEFARTKIRTSAIKVAIEGLLGGDVIAECAEAEGAAATECVDRFETEQRVAMVRTFSHWLGAGWDTYPQGADEFREWRERGLAALNSEQVRSAGEGLTPLDNWERELNQEASLLVQYPACLDH